MRTACETVTRDTARLVEDTAATEARIKATLNKTEAVEAQTEGIYEEVRACLRPACCLAGLIYTSAPFTATHSP